MSDSASTVRSSGRAGGIVLSGQVTATLAAVYSFVLVLGVVLGRTRPLPPPVPVTSGAALIAGLAGIAAVSRQLSAVPMLALAAVATAGIAVIGDVQSANVCWFGVVLLSGLIALVCGRTAGLVYWVAASVLFAVQWAMVGADPGWAAWLGGTTTMLLMGLLLRHQFGLLDRLRAAQAGLAASARAEERNRIARDLHDVIAHTLTVSLLHVMSARLAVEHEPAHVALEALEEAERLGRESLTEVRQVVGMLRTGERPDGTTSPLPGIDGLEPLVSRFKAAGACVSYAQEGDTGPVPATVGLALHRILQEALTNVIKHAEGSAASVRLAVADGEVTLTVDSTGTPGLARGTGGGHGLTGMRERAESLGGTCTAGPAGRGWLVRAAFPFTGRTAGGS